MPRPHAIVVTGGPGGGKTTALDLFQRELKDQVKVVPEAATMLFANGLNRDLARGSAALLQASIYRMQKDSPVNGTSATMPTGISGPMGGW